MDDIFMLSDGYELSLPYPPSNNHYKQITCYTKKTGGVKVYTSAITRKYYADVYHLFIKQKGKCMENKRLRIEIDFHPKANTSGRKMDLDNALKCVCDALQKAGAFADDNNIWSLQIERKEEILNGGLKVRIYPL